MPAMQTKLSVFKKRPHSENGQVLIIMAFAITALIAFIGLVVDLGLVYIGHSQLRKAVDAAALAASLQYRKNYVLSDLVTSATEFLTLNGINDPSATVVTCEEEPLLCDKNGDGVISESEHRKLVKVIASTTIHLAFLPVIGISEVPISAEAVSEAASVDVVLVIDRSESMTNDGIVRDPSVCNADPPPYSGGGFSGSCDPFTDVKRAADAFVNNLFFPYDRVAVVSFDRLIHCASSPIPLCGNAGDHLSLALTSVENQIHTRLKNLWVYQAGDDNDPGGVGTVGFDGEQCNSRPNYYSDPRYLPGPQAAPPCRLYNDTTKAYGGFDCPNYYVNHTAESCTTTNIGGGLLAAGNEFTANSRPEALWVVILLTDGSANSSTDISGNLPFGFCPAGTKDNYPFCRDSELEQPAGSGNYIQTRHCYDNPDPALQFTPAMRAMCLGVTNPTWDFAGTPDNGTHYDADDFARDMADWLATNNVLTFSINLGTLGITESHGDPKDGEELLQYVAGVGGGQYFYAPTSDQLRQIFAKIADNIATRLSR